MPRSKSLPIQLLLFPLFIVLMLVLAALFGDELRGLLDQLRRAGDEANPWRTATLLVLIQVLQVVVFVIPGEVVQIAAGFLFGVAGGAAVSVAGILIGSCINYGVGRLLGRPFVDAITSERGRQRITRLFARRSSRVAFFLLFVIPGLPKDILGYVAGSQPRQFPFGPFVAFSMIGRLPGIVGSAIIGTSAAAGRVWLSAVLMAAAAVILVAGLWNQKRLEAWLTNRLGSESDSAEDG